MGGCVSGNSPTEDIEYKKGDMKRNNKKNDKKITSAPNSGRQLISSTANVEQVD